MGWLATYGLFLAKTITFVIAILVVVMGIMTLVSKARNKFSNKLLIKKLNDKYETLRSELRAQIFSKKDYKQALKQEKAAKKAQKDQLKPRLFVLHFDGDIRASAVSDLREEITAILTIATPQDEVLVSLESGGGMVHSYGLAASQLQRLRDQHIPLTVSVDKIAASGGYMMACVANKIIAAPFAIIGSIGVVAQLPNFNRLLKSKNIDFEQLTAGEYKRTLTLFGENTDEGREKMQQELEETHTLFKEFIKRHRPQVDLTKTATGEHWFATQALEFLLIDELKTSDDYVMAHIKTHDVYAIAQQSKKSLGQRLGKTIQETTYAYFKN